MCRHTGYLVLASLGRVLHRHDNSAAGAHEVHRAAHALHHLPRDDPVGQVAILANLETTELLQLHEQRRVAEPNPRQQLGIEPRSRDLNRIGSGPKALKMGQAALVGGRSVVVQ